MNENILLGILCNLIGHDDILVGCIYVELKSITKEISESMRHNFKPRSDDYYREMKGF